MTTFSRKGVFFILVEAITFLNKIFASIIKEGGEMNNGRNALLSYLLKSSLIFFFGKQITF